MTNLPVAGKARIVLIVSPSEECQQALAHILRPAGWRLERALGWLQAMQWLIAESAPVVIVERDLPDGNWKTLHHLLTEMPLPPNLIVTCRLADERLWAEALNLGGFDVLAQPFCAGEVLRSVHSAYGHWDEELRRAHGAIEQAHCCATA